jgi:hypothetical protein
MFPGGLLQCLEDGGASGANDTETECECSICEEIADAASEGFSCNFESGLARRNNIEDIGSGNVTLTPRSLSSSIQKRDTKRITVCGSVYKSLNYYSCGQAAIRLPDAQKSVPNSNYLKSRD